MLPQSPEIRKNQVFSVSSVKPEGLHPALPSPPCGSAGMVGLAAVTDGHRLHGLKQQTLILPQPEARSSKPRCHGAVLPPQPPGSPPWLLQLLGAAGHHPQPTLSACVCPCSQPKLPDMI